MACVYLIRGLDVDLYLLACECLRLKEMWLFKLDNYSSSNTRLTVNRASCGSLCLTFTLMSIFVDLFIYPQKLQYN